MPLISSHKSQGMTLPCMKVHGVKELCPGSRAKEPIGIPLVGFSKANIISPPMVVDNFYTEIDNGCELCPLDHSCNNSDLQNQADPQFSYCGTDCAWYICNLGDFDITEEKLTKIDNSVKDFFEIYPYEHR